MIATKAKQVLFILALSPVMCSASAFACQVVGYANGEPLCMTTSDASGYNDARPGRWWMQRRAAMNAQASTPAAHYCSPGYVWRDAADGDGVCVTPEDRAVAKMQNANAANNRQIGGGAYGPMTCRQGYVWREAFQGDTVCVTPYERTQAQQQNAAAR